MRAFPQIAVAQVEAVYPETLELGIALPNYGSMHGIRVRIAAANAGPVTGHYALPAVGEFGLVAFYADDSNSGAWVMNLPSRLWSPEPREILSADPRAVATYHRDGRRELHTGAGDHEFIYPDGTLLRLSASKDGSVSNAGRRSERTPMTRTVDADPGSVSREQQREEYTPPAKPPLDIRLEHSSGAIVTITADGSFNLTTPAGHALKLHDATEKARDADGSVLSAPEEDASRVASEVVLESEGGHRFILHDDPVLLTDRRITIQHPGGHEVTLKDDPNVNADKRVTIKTGGGHEVELRDLPGADMYARVRTVAGHTFELRDSPSVRASLTTPGGRSVVLDDDAGETRVSDPAKVVVDAPRLELAGAGRPFARVGDKVATPAGVGTIKEGSPNVFTS